jgi:3-hydroxyisobutyrate dehydrogenase/glyoxylate/succinic semialdehyde reductase
MSGADAAKEPSAVLGLGIVGSRAYGRLVEAGWPVQAWNRTPKGLAGEHEDAGDAVRGARWISLFLKDAPAVREVFERIASGLTPGHVVLNHSTVDLATTRWLGARCAEAGCGFLDVPFTGSKLAAASGQLLYYAAGDPALLEQAESYLRVTSRGWIRCGDIGAATVVKLATNLISACTVQALAEAFAIASRHGIDGERFVSVVAQSASASMLSGMKLPAMAAGDFEPHFTLSNMEKDSRYVRELAAEVGLQTPAIDAVSARMAELCATGLADLDFSALAKAYL